MVEWLTMPRCQRVWYGFESRYLGFEILLCSSVMERVAALIKKNTEGW